MIEFKLFYFVLYTIAVFLFYQYINLFNYLNYSIDYLFYNVKNHSTYDYIIVGAGSAGTVLANRLSKANKNVLLVEAGSAPLKFFNIPLLTPLLQRTVFDWQYKTEPQENACKGLKNNQSIWVSGKILGGSSRLNYMIYARGHPEDYASWFADFKEPITEYGGPLNIEEPKWHSKISDAILQGINELSYNFKNINKGNNTGFMRVESTSKNGARWSNDRILDENQLDNLHILLNAYVYKVLFKYDKAIGIQYLKHNEHYKAFAKKAVILSAGTVGSAKLLLLSGIGPKSHLRDKNIKVVADLPVGQNLMDHLITGLDLVLLNSSSNLNIADAINPISFLEYFFFSKGSWTTTGVEIIGTFHSSLQPNESAAPDLQIMVLSSGLSQDNGVVLRNNIGISNQVYQKYFAPLVYKNVITIAPVLLHPNSYGEIKLKSSNPLDPPLINPKYLTDEKDLLTLLDGIKFVKKLINSKAMKKFGAELYNKSYPGCDNYIFDTDNYWKCYVRHLSVTTYHPAGTCKLGDVVDSTFRVYKVKNLYVADASVLPILPSANTNAAVTMLAEKAASILLLNENTKFNLNVLKKCYPIDLFLKAFIC